MPRRRRRQTLPALLLGTVAETVQQARRKKPSTSKLKLDERGEVASPLPTPRRERVAAPAPLRPAAEVPRPRTPRPKTGADRRPKTKIDRTAQTSGQTGSRIVVGLLVIALGVPFFTMQAVRPAVALGTISYGGHVGTAAAMGTGESLTLTTTDGVPRGNSVVLSFATEGVKKAGSVSASDSAGNTYSVDADGTLADDVRTVVLSAHNVDRIPSGSTITINHPSSDARAVSANHFAGLASAGVLDASNANAGSGTELSSGSVSTSEPNTLLVGAFGIDNDSTFSATGGFTPLPGYVAPGVGQLATQYSIVSSSGSYASTGSLETSGRWAGAIAAYRLDTEAPTVAISEPTNDGRVTATPTFRGTAGDGNSDSDTVTLKLYEGTSTSGTPVEVETQRAEDGVWTYDQTTPLGDGTYTLVAEQEDSATNVGTSSAMTFTVDTVAPDAPSVTSPSPDPGNDNTVEWGFLGEAGGTYECRLAKDSQVISSYETCTSPAGYLLSDGDGIYTFSVRQIDDAGNVGPASSDDYVLDTQAPDAPAITGPDPDPSNNDKAVWTFESEPGATTECRLTKGVQEISSWAGCTSPVTHTLVDGDATYTFSVRQTDRGGNESPTASEDYTLDTTVPTTTIESGPNGLTNSATVSFEFSSDDPTATFECNLDGGGFTACSSPAEYSTLGDGSHQFEVRAVDEAGNIDPSPDIHTFTLDTGAPPLAIDTAPDDPGRDTSVSWGFSSETGAAIECELSRDGNVVAPFADCSSGTASYDLGADGLYTLNVRASDAAGNTSTASDTYVLDTTDPTSSATSTPLTADPSITVGYSAGDGNSGVSEVELWVNAPGSDNWVLADVDTSLSGSFTYTGDASGTYSFYTRARDLAGNYEGAPGGPDTQTVLDTEAPTVSIDAAPSDPTSEPVLSFSFTSADPTVSFSCSLTGDGSDAYSPCSSPAAYTSPDVTTAYTFKVLATDAAGNVGPPSTWSFMYVEPEPEPEPTPTQTETVEPSPSVTETVEPTPSVTETVDPSPSVTETFTPEPPTTPEPTVTPDPPPPPPEEDPPPPGGGTVVRVDDPEEPKAPATPEREPKEKPEAKQKPELQRMPPGDDPGVGQLLPSNTPDDPVSRLAELAQFAAEAVKTFAFPLLLAILVIAFLLVQYWIDKKDPKLAMAPVHSNHDLTRFG